MKVAIAAYVDYHPDKKFIDECNLMTFSGRDLDDRFTFLIYAHPSTAAYIDTYKNVKVIPYSVPNKKYYEDYKFAKSLVFAYDNEKDFLEYDYICKTDTDVIISPNMNNFPFKEDAIYVGKGYYTFNNKMIKDYKVAALRWGYPNYKRIGDMHSTVVCSSKNLINIMRLSDELCEKMYYEWHEDGVWGISFFRGSVGNNSGVCSMYAMEIVISSMYEKKDIVITQKIDAGSDWDTDYNLIYHYHCYHHDFIYSKFQAKYGAYLNLDYQDGVASSDYCLNTYLKRKNLGLSNPELFNKPRFTLVNLPSGFNNQYSIKYNHKKNIKTKKEKSDE
jgi:hypothetical protein